MSKKVEAVQFNKDNHILGIKLEGNDALGIRIKPGDRSAVVIDRLKTVIRYLEEGFEVDYGSRSK